MEKFKPWSDIIATWVTIIGVLSGGILALIQYGDRISEERVKESLKYVDRYNSGRILDARTEIEHFWDDKNRIKKLQKKQSEPELARLIVSEIDSSRAVSDDFNLVLSFYDNLRICTCARLCDMATITSFFGSEAYKLNGLFFPYIAKQRKLLNDDEIGVSLYLLATKSKNPGFAQSFCAGMQRPWTFTA